MAKRHQTSSPAYEQRLIVFLDFLGFKEVVASTKNDSRALRRLIAALDDIGCLGNADFFKSQRVTQFSDSVVMSYLVTEQSGVFMMINEIALTIISLAERGFLLRGAVTIGDLHHTSRHLVGPAMVRAYEMELKEALYPRVIIDPAVIRLARRRRSEDHSPDDEEGYVRAFIAEDTDGRLFIDYISWNAVVAVAGAEDGSYPDYLATLGRLLRDGLAHDDPRVAEKYQWLHPRYLSALDLICNLLADACYRLENPKNCEIIKNLPRLRQLARMTKRRVDRFHADQDRRARLCSQ